MAITREDAKWSHLIPADANLPTGTKDDCERSDWDDSNPAPPGTILKAGLSSRVVCLAERLSIWKHYTEILSVS